MNTEGTVSFRSSPVCEASSKGKPPFSEISAQPIWVSLPYDAKNRAHHREVDEQLVVSCLPFLLRHPNQHARPDYQVDHLLHQVKLLHVPKTHAATRVKLCSIERGFNKTWVLLFIIVNQQ